jgi:hypothetical protein
VGASVHKSLQKSIDTRSRKEYRFRKEKSIPKGFYKNLRNKPLKALSDSEFKLVVDMLLNASPRKSSYES